MLDDDLDRLGVGILRDVLVLEQTVLGGATAAEFDAKFDETKHDRLEGRERRLLETTRGENLIERLQSSRRLANVDQLCSESQQEASVSLEARNSSNRMRG